MKRLICVLAAASLMSISGFAQKEDIKDAAKSTGEAAKKTGKKIKKGTKKAVNKSAEAVEKGADKVGDKTK